MLILQHVLSVLVQNSGPSAESSNDGGIEQRVRGPTTQADPAWIQNIQWPQGMMQRCCVPITSAESQQNPRAPLKDLQRLRLYAHLCQQSVPNFPHVRVQW